MPNLSARERLKTTKRATRKTSSTKTDAKVAKPQRTRKTVPSEATANVSVETPNKAAVEVSTIANEVVTHKEDTKTTLRRGRAATPSNKRKLFVLDTNVLIHDPLSIFRFAEHDVFLPMTVLEELDNHKKGTSDVARNARSVSRNVLIHDPLSIFRFAEHDVFLPMTVLEELDNHKKGTSDVARNARSVSRNLDQLMELHGTDLSAGVPLHLLGNKEATGHLFFETRTITAPIPDALPTFKGDNRILAVVKGVEAAFPDLAVVLVSKDINMRIKATTLGIPAEDYLSDKVLDDTDMLYTGRMVLPKDFWTQCGESLKSWQDDGTTHYRFEADDAHRYIVNMCLTIEGDPDFMAMVTSVEHHTVTIRLLRDYRSRLKVWGIHARNAEQNMALNLLTDPEIDFVTLLGQAGTGKTLMTLAAALTQTIDERRFSEIIVTRATVSVGDDIGFLPGTEEEKMAPWMGALEDNLEVLHRSEGSAGGEWGRQAVSVGDDIGFLPGTEEEKMAPWMGALEDNLEVLHRSEGSAGGEWGRQATLDLIKARIRIKSMSFMRGRTFLKKFVIIDEAQNLSPKQMKTLITRAGPGTKIVCLGNIAQIDTPYLTEGSSGLTYVVERFQGWPHAATITLTRGERSSPKQMKTLITRAGPGTKIVCLGNIAQIDTPYLTEGSSGLTYVVERFQGWPHAATITLTRGERSRLADFATEVL